MALPLLFLLSSGLSRTFSSLLLRRAVISLIFIAFHAFFFPNLHLHNVSHRFFTSSKSFLKVVSAYSVAPDIGPEGSQNSHFSSPRTRTLVSMSPFYPEHNFEAAAETFLCLPPFSFSPFGKMDFSKAEILSRVEGAEEVDSAMKELTASGGGNESEVSHLSSSNATASSSSSVLPLAVFYSLGDWGTAGKAQRKVADVMSEAASLFPPLYVLSLGDNFYDFGVDAVDDPIWDNVFEDVYNSTSLKDLKFYSTLGNHDYRGNPWAQIARHYYPNNTRWIFPNYWYYMRHNYIDVPSSIDEGIFNGINTISELTNLAASAKQTSSFEVVSICIDTILLSLHEPQDWLIPYELTMELFNIQKKFIVDTIKAAAQTADWIFVYGHYPIYTTTKRHSLELKNFLIPLFKQYGVDAYFCGHDHFLGHFEDSDISYILSGAGGKHPTPATCLENSYACKYAAAKNGFTTHLLTSDKMYSYWIDDEGNIVYRKIHQKRQKNPDTTPDSQSTSEQEVTSFPVIKRLYIGPDPAQSSVHLTLQNYITLGALGGFILGVGCVLLGFFSKSLYRRVKNRQYIRVGTNLVDEADTPF